jgi:hypothetical protein
LHWLRFGLVIGWAETGWTVGMEFSGRVAIEVFQGTALVWVCVKKSIAGVNVATIYDAGCAGPMRSVDDVAVFGKADNWKASFDDLVIKISLIVV